MSSDIILGIDLGTTFSVAACVHDDGSVRVIENAEGQKTTPSVVLIDNGLIQVGAIAANQAMARPEYVVSWIKRAMGDPDYRFQGLSAIEISAGILKKIKADCEAELAQPLNRAVITVPAYFAANEVENTRRAGELAGFEVQEIVKEPTAAAVYYGVEHLKDGEKMLVCDLGGGTFDASILTLKDGIFTPLATVGDRMLGGHDWTEALVKHVADLLTDIYGEDPRNDLAVGQALYEACEKAKRSFARAEEAVIPCVFRGQTAEVKVLRSEFEQMTEWGIQRMLRWTQDSLTKARTGLNWADIDHILLVGGSTRLRRVPEVLTEISGKQPIQTAEVDTMVALGAAILAKGSYKPRRVAEHSGLSLPKGETRLGITRIVKRIAERNLGTRVLLCDDDRHWHIENSAIIHFGTELPADKTRTDYQLTVPNQSYFDVPIVEFDGIGLDVIQTTWRFTCPPAIPTNTQVHVTFSYNLSGEITVTAVEQAQRTTLSAARVDYQEPNLEQLMASAPRDIVFAIDISGSMASHGKIERAKQAVIQNTQELLKNGGGQVRIGVVTFDSHANTISPLTTDVHAISQQVSRIDANGSTAMAEGLNAAIGLLSSTGNQREIVLVSDGAPDSAPDALLAAGHAFEQGIQLSIVGIGREDVDENFLNQLSQGRFFVIGNDASQLSSTISLLTQSQPKSGKQGITWLGGSNG